MNSFNRDGRRSLDGPIRRTSPLESSQDSIDQGANSAVPSYSEASSSSAPERVFEYRKPYKSRGIFLRYVRIFAILLLIAGVGIGGWIGVRAFLAARSIIGQSQGGAPGLASKLDVTQLKGEGDGRINVLVLGIGGAGHEGPNLTDTIIVMSIDPKKKDAAMLSIPRDLYVKLPAVSKYNTQYGKINAAHVYGGPQYAEKIVSGIIGVPIHYYVVVDFSGFRQAIDAVGGIDLTVPTAIYDSRFPCDSGNGKYCPLTVKAGFQHMNGTQALRYARSRKSTSDFDRADRQQIVITALREKTLQLSTLTNPVKLTGLINSLGGHVKTDLQPGEIAKMATLIKDLDVSKMVQKVLSTEGTDALLDGGTNLIPEAGYIELPKAGNFNYVDIQNFVKNIFVDNYIIDENARLEIQNGSGVSGVAAAVATSLKSAHYNVREPVNAANSYTKTVLYDYTGGKKPYTINYLEQRFKVKAQKMAAPSPSSNPSGVTGTVPEIRIILGSDYQSASSNR